MGYPIKPTKLGSYLGPVAPLSYAPHAYHASEIPLGFMGPLSSGLPMSYADSTALSKWAKPIGKTLLRVHPYARFLLTVHDVWQDLKYGNPNIDFGGYPNSCGPRVGRLQGWYPISGTPTCIGTGLPAPFWGPNPGGYVRRGQVQIFQNWVNAQMQGRTKTTGTPTPIVNVAVPTVPQRDRRAPFELPIMQPTPQLPAVSPHIVTPAPWDDPSPTQLPNGPWVRYLNPKTNVLRFPVPRPDRSPYDPPLPGPIGRPARDPLDPEFEPTPGPVPRDPLTPPSPMPTPSTAPKQGTGLEPGTEGPVLIISMGSPVMVQDKPRKKEKEIKTRATRWMGLAWAAFNAVTEARDFIKALHKALPKRCKTRMPTKRKGPAFSKFSAANAPTIQQMYMDVYQCIASGTGLPYEGRHGLQPWEEGKFLNDAIDNLITDQIKDKVFGKFGKALGQASNKSGRPIGFGAGPAL